MRFAGGILLAAWLLSFATAEAQGLLGPAAGENLLEPRSLDDWLTQAEAGKFDEQVRLADVIDFCDPPAEVVLPRLLKLATEGNDEQCLQALEALARLGPRAKEARDPLWQLFKGSEPPRSEAIAKALGALGPEAEPLLPKIASLESSKVIDELLPDRTPILLGIGEPAAVAMAKDLESEDKARALRALARLAKFGKQAAPAVPVIAKALADPALAADAAYALKMLGPVARPALPAVVRELSRPTLHWKAPSDAKRVYVGEEWHTADCRSLLQDVIVAVGESDEACVAALHEAILKHDDSSCRRAAAALAKLRPVTAQSARALLDAAVRLDALRPRYDRWAAENNLRGRRIPPEAFDEFGRPQLARVDYAVMEFVAAMRQADAAGQLEIADAVSRLPVEMQMERDCPLVTVNPKQVGLRSEQLLPYLTSDHWIVQSWAAAQWPPGEPIPGPIADRAIRKLRSVPPEGRQRLWAALGGIASWNVDFRARLLPLAVEHLQSAESVRVPQPAAAVRRGRFFQQIPPGEKHSPRMHVADGLELMAPLDEVTLAETERVWRELDGKLHSKVFIEAGPPGARLLASRLEGESYLLRSEAQAGLVACGPAAAAALPELFAATLYRGNDYRPAAFPHQRALGSCGTLALPRLAETYEKNLPAQYKMWLLHCLSSRWFASYDAPQARTMLKLALTDENAGVRLTAVETIDDASFRAVRPHPELVALIDSLVRNDVESEIRMRATQALFRWQVCDRELLEPIAKMTADPLTRYQALSMLQPLGARALPALPELRPILMELWLDESIMPRSESKMLLRLVAALGPAGSSAAAELRAIARSREHACRCDAAYALWRVAGDRRALLVLADALSFRATEGMPASRPPYQAQLDALECLGEIGPAARELAPLLSARLLDGGPLQPQFAAALCRIQLTPEAEQIAFDAAFPELAPSVVERNESLSLAKPRAELLAMSLRNASSRIEPMADSPHAVHRLTACRALWLLGDREAALRASRDLLAREFGLKRTIRKPEPHPESLELCRLLFDAGPAAKSLAPDLVVALKHCRAAYRAELFDALWSVDPTAAQALVNEWAKMDR